MPGLGIVEAHSIEEYEGLSEGRSPDGEVRLNAVNSALAKINRGFQAEIVHRGAEEQRLFPGIE
jgi:hypothetical protein